MFLLKRLHASPHWLTPDPRGILEFDDLYVSRRLARRLKRGEFQFTIDRAFADVVEGCAAPRGDDDDCWLTLSMQNAYLTMHELGHAHSIEAWQGGRLVGGLFGMAIGGLFAAESMFHRQSDASKVALAALIERLASGGFVLLDVQFLTDHLASLGAITVSRDAYLAGRTLFADDQLFSIEEVTDTPTITKVGSLAYAVPSR